MGVVTIRRFIVLIHSVIETTGLNFWSLQPNGRESQVWVLSWGGASCAGRRPR